MEPITRLVKGSPRSMFLIWMNCSVSVCFSLSLPPSLSPSLPPSLSPYTRPHRWHHPISAIRFVWVSLFTTRFLFFVFLVANLKTSLQLPPPPPLPPPIRIESFPRLPASLPPDSVIYWQKTSSIRNFHLNSAVFFFFIWKVELWFLENNDNNEKKKKKYRIKSTVTHRTKY